jgi:hypothetical protein
MCPQPAASLITHTSSTRFRHDAYALAKRYAKAVIRAVGNLADLLVTAAISHLSRAQITSPYREAVWRECLEFAGQLAHWDRYAIWVDRVVHINWQVPLNENGAIDRERVEQAAKERREFFEKRIDMYWLEWLGAIDREIEVRLRASAPQVKAGYREDTVLQDDGWRELGDGFASLAKEERTISHNISEDCSLRAQCDYANHPEVLERGKPDQGFFCLLDKPEHGLWMLYGGPNENVEAKFRTLATRAGLSLGTPQGTLPEDFWLHRLFHNLRENGSKELFAASGEGGMILHGCQASANFCVRLEKTALERSSSSSPRAIDHRKVSTTDPEVAKRRSIARSNRGICASEMSEIFDREKVPFPRRWVDAGFPSWTKAYRNHTYRGRIDTLISKRQRETLTATFFLSFASFLPSRGSA